MKGFLKTVLARRVEEQWEAQDERKDWLKPEPHKKRLKGPARKCAECGKTLRRDNDTQLCSVHYRKNYQKTYQKTSKPWVTRFMYYKLKRLESDG